MSSPPHSPRQVLLVLPAIDAAGEKAPRAPGGGKKPAVAVRVWSEADEVRILEGLAAYALAHGAPPVRSQLHAALEGRGLDKAEFTVTEIYEKVRRLRIKYANLRSAGGPPAGGADDGDEVRKYELSRSIWGDQLINAGTKRKRGGAVPPKAPKADGNSSGVRRGFEELQGLFPNLAAEVERITTDKLVGPVLKRAFELINDQEAGRLDDKAKRQMVIEMQATIKLNALRNEVLKTLLNSID